jgi:hypothetical protein
VGVALLEWEAESVALEVKLGALPVAAALAEAVDEWERLAVGEEEVVEETVFVPLAVVVAVLVAQALRVLVPLVVVV